MGGVLSPFVEWTIGVAAFATAASVVWAKWVVPSWRFTRSVVDAVDILVDIAAHFRPNGGSSLWDRITSLENGQQDLAEGIASNREDLAQLKIDSAEMKRQMEQVILEELAQLNLLAGMDKRSREG